MSDYTALVARLEQFVFVLEQNNWSGKWSDLVREAIAALVPPARCVGYDGKCDGDLEGEPHEPHCPAYDAAVDEPKRQRRQAVDNSLATPADRAVICEGPCPECGAWAVHCTGCSQAADRAAAAQAPDYARDGKGRARCGQAFRPFGAVGDLHCSRLAGHDGSCSWGAPPADRAAAAPAPDGLDVIANKAAVELNDAIDYGVLTPDDAVPIITRAIAEALRTRPVLSDETLREMAQETMRLLAFDDVSPGKFRAVLADEDNHQFHHARRGIDKIMAFARAVLARQQAGD